MKKTISFAIVLLAVINLSCNNQNRGADREEAVHSDVKQNKNDMKSHVSLFEIPATDISRAIKFYQSILNINIEQMEMPDMKMGIFPYEDQVVTGVIMQAEGYQPTADGVTVYLNGGDDLQSILDKVEASGGQIILPKTAHADESGFFALFLDTEGNKLGLNSPN
ncbi:VOC family protein [Crocinitomix catalasitica]|uniref:VOC family protein n=1 Tax=Crocinitomix catalasitica TaxID=184607 RepID=UPI000489C9BD|nr:VOC family protein [Crocinitomix catalasitica]